MSKLEGGKVVGKVQMKPIDSVTKNPWNPNRMSVETRASLRYGLQRDGWLASQSLLVWGTDEHGVAQNVIIDGEHRWLVGKEVGITVAPMVFLDGVSAVKAKALTIAMNQRRGDFNPDDLGKLVRSLDGEIDDLALATGISAGRVEEMVSPLSDEQMAGAVPPMPAADAGFVPPPAIRTVQLLFAPDKFDAFQADMKVIGARVGARTVTDAVMAALREAAGR